MSEPTAQRTLVKSPPELWAEVSDVECLARHLGEFGDIRITRVEPETTVAWEGERASGTVKLEPSGWGTKVTLTATATAAETVEPPEPEPSAVEPNVQNPPPGELDMDVRAAEPEDVALEPLAVAPAPVTANELLAKSGFFSRMFKRRRAEIGGPSAPTPAPAPPTPVPDPTPAPAPPTPVPDPTPAPDPEPPLPEPTPLPQRDPDPEPPAAAEAAPPLDVAGVLTGVLDALGAAHHRPFSR